MKQSSLVWFAWRTDVLCFRKLEIIIDSEMSRSNENVCQHYKFGFCKFANKCKYIHVKELCIERSCEKSNCNKRHPVTCFFYRQFNRCKFGSFCLYSHQDNERKKKINDLENKITNLEEKVGKLEKKLKKQADLENKIKALERKVEEVENMLESNSSESSSSADEFHGDPIDDQDTKQLKVVIKKSKKNEKKEDSLEIENVGLTKEEMENASHWSNQPGALERSEQKKGKQLFKRV